MTENIVQLIRRKRAESWRSLAEHLAQLGSDDKVWKDEASRIVAKATDEECREYVDEATGGPLV